MKKPVQYNKPIQNILYLLLFCTSNTCASNAKKNTKLKKSFTTGIVGEFHFDKKNPDTLVVSSLENNELLLHTYDITKPNQQPNLKTFEFKNNTKGRSWIQAKNQNMIIRQSDTHHVENFFVHLIKSKKSKQKPICIKHNSLQTHVEAIALHPKKNMVALFNIAMKKNSSKLTVWEIKKNRAQKKTSISLPKNHVNHLTFPNNEYLVAAYNHRHCYIYNYKTKDKKQRLRHCLADTGSIREILFVPNIGSNSDNKPDLLIARRKDILALDSSNLKDKLSSYEPIIKIDGDDIESIALNHNQTVLAVLNPDLVCFNYNNGQELYYGETGSSCVVYPGNIAFNADDTKVAIHAPFRIEVYDVPKQKIESLKKLAAFVIGKHNIDTSKIPKLLLQGTCLQCN